MMSNLPSNCIKHEPGKVAHASAVYKTAVHGPGEDMATRPELVDVFQSFHRLHLAESLHGLPKPKASVHVIVAVLALAVIMVPPLRELLRQLFFINVLLVCRGVRNCALVTSVQQRDCAHHTFGFECLSIRLRHCRPVLDWWQLSIFLWCSRLLLVEDWRRLGALRFHVCVWLIQWVLPLAEVRRDRFSLPFSCLEWRHCAADNHKNKERRRGTSSRLS